MYLERGRRRTGGGRELYEALFDRLAERGFRIAVAGMTLPNPASVGLHRAMGFAPVGTYRRIGWKHGRWHDVAWVSGRSPAARIRLWSHADVLHRWVVVANSLILTDPPGGVRLLTTCHRGPGGRFTGLDLG